MNLTSLRKEYEAGRRPSEIISLIYSQIEAQPLNPTWISLVARESSLSRARDLERQSAAGLPLYGVPFAVKDNFDVEGMATTAGCPAFAYTPKKTAHVVQRLIDAGGILIGKTNMDQFATGLVGTRSPYGACSSVFDDRYISGGSSSGSAVAVARELVAFSLGTDTAGSGRVPAAFNNLVGLKPTRGLLSTSGVVPACRTLDCVSIFAHDCADAHAVWSSARGFDPSDAFSREPRPGEGAAPWLSGESFRFGVSPANQLDFFGAAEAESLYHAAVGVLEKLGGRKVEIDFSIFRKAADLLYSGPWVAERMAAIREFMETNGDQMNPVVREIISGATRYSAMDAFRAEYQLRELRRAAEIEWTRMDFLFLPTTGTIYTHDQIEADPIKLNTNLGYYTNFVNLLDLAAVAVPAGMRTNGLPFGVSIIGPAFSDEALLSIAAAFHRHSSGGSQPLLEFGTCPPGCVEIAVVGAHLTGQPLNKDLTDRGARLLRTVSTTEGYRLYALEGRIPKPGLIREESFQGLGIEVEVWAMPEDRFGGFVNSIPAPLGIGTVTLASGQSVKCFLCEPYAVAGAREITHFGGWRNYLTSVNSRGASAERQ